MRNAVICAVIRHANARAALALRGRGRAPMKILDVTEFYSERGGGVRSHLALKGHVLCQLGHEHVVVAPGSHDDETLLVGGGRGSAQGGTRNDERVGDA